MPLKDPEARKEYRKKFYQENKQTINEKLKEKRLEKGKKAIDYSNGKIYKIEPTVEHDENEIYIGSTAMQYLSQRMGGHRNGYKKWKNGKGNKIYSFILFDKYGFENCEIILLESVNANCIDELRARENHFIRTLKNINGKVEGRTVKEYYLDNIEKIKETHKARELKNWDLRKQQKHDNYLKNKDRRFVCECGADVLYLSRQRHFNRDKHKQLMLKKIV